MLRPRTPVPTTICTPRSRRRSGSGRHPRSPWLEELERRELLATFWVSNTDDGGDGSLRQAILDANTVTGPDNIYFAIDSGVQTIRVFGLLPRVEEAVTIDATTQPGYGGELRPLIELDGTASNGDGLVIQASDCEIRGLAVNHFGANGIRLIGGGHSTIQGCFLGVAPDGHQARGNSGDGLRIENSPDNTIGGAAFGDGNLISGNGGVGIWIRDAAARTQVQGNLIGTDQSGLTAVANGTWGIIVSNGRDNTIGGTAAGAGNVISGNGQGGVAVYGGTATGNVVQGNLIGTDVNGTAALGNAYSGVYVGDGSGFGPPYPGSASNNTIGGTEPGAGNVIAGNGNYGVWINGAGASGNLVQGNRIGTDESGTRPLGNALSGVALTEGAHDNTVGGGQSGARNLISGNAQRGVVIDGAGTTGNRVQGNLIGTDVNGAGPLANGWYGVHVQSGAAANVVGTDGDGVDDATEGNVISGNAFDGVILAGVGTDWNVVAGNYIGTNAAGTSAVGNSRGILVSDQAKDNRIGTDADGRSDGLERNVISGNNGDGVQVRGAGTENTRVVGNSIGTNAAGTAALGNGLTGVFVGGGSAGNTIGGTADGQGNLISGNGGFGVLITDSGTSLNLVAGNRIGTNATGTAKVPNAVDGVRLRSGTDRNTIGGTTAAARNLISGNGGAGIWIRDVAARTLVQGNLIGTDQSGLTAVANGTWGIIVSNGRDNTIGGTAAGAGNVISGNGQGGVAVYGGTATGNVLQGNFIGTDVNGTAALGNAFSGVYVGDSIGFVTPYPGSASNNTIGGTVPGAGNVISANGKHGVEIRGPGASGNLVQGNRIGTDAAGTAALGNGLSGVSVRGGSAGNTIGGTADGQGNLISGNGLYGVEIADPGTSLNLVAGNRIGTNAMGTAKVPNAFNGVDLSNGTDRNTIGGTTAAARNLISGNNGSGVVLNISATNANVITGNFIGTDVGGTAKLANALNGVSIAGGTTNNTVGGTTSGSRNVIAGNGGYGVQFLGGSSANRVQGNAIGTDLAGTLALGNAVGGVRIDASAGNTIGGTATGAGNVVAFNGGAGVAVVGSASTGDTIEGNAIFSNARLGIDLGGDLVTANHAANPASGPNRWQNTPVLTTAVSVGGTTTVQGTLASAPNAAFRVEVFSDLVADPSGFGQGRTFLGALTVTTNAAGFASFNWPSPIAVTPGQVVSATATSAGGDTSEFSRTITVFTATATTVSSSAADATYGQALTFTAIVGGLAPGNVIPTGTVQFQVDGAAFGGPVTLVGGMATSAVVTRMSAGTHTIIAVYSGDAADLGSASAGLVQAVAKAHLIVTADAASMTYGDPVPALAATIAGFVPGEDTTSAGITGSASLFTTADSSSPVGTHPIVTGVGTLAAANYDFHPVDGNLVVTPAPLTVVPSDARRIYGDPNPELVGTISGLRNGDPIAALYSTVATASSPAGDYDITATLSDAAGRLGNYAITFVSGVLDVTPAPLTVRADDKTRTYGAANPALTATYVGFVNGDTAAGLTTPVSLSTPAGAPSHVGTYPIVASGGGSPNYSITLTAGVLTVSPASLVIAADDSSKVYAQPLPPLTVSYSGFVNGEGPGDLAAPPAVSTAADALSPLGTYPIRAAGASSPDYLIRYVDGSLAVRSVDVQSDPLDASRRILVVGGTSGNDEVKFIAAQGIRVNLNGTTLGTYDGISGLVAFGGPGDDSIKSSREVTLPTLFFGGEGNDQLEGGGGDHALVGGAGDDSLDAGGGRSVLIGGAGADQLRGLRGDTVLIAGSTRYDMDVAALEAILAEWGSVRDYETRVANLSGPAGGPRSNGDVFLVVGPVSTVLDDQESDVLEGGSGQDWYFADLSADPRTKDSIRRRKKGEAVTQLGA